MEHIPIKTVLAGGASLMFIFSAAGIVFACELRSFVRKARGKWIA